MKVHCLLYGGSLFTQRKDLSFVEPLLASRHGRTDIAPTSPLLELFRSDGGGGGGGMAVMGVVVVLAAVAVAAAAAAVVVVLLVIVYVVGVKF